MDYAEKNNPDKKKETCLSFIEKTRSEFCTIAKNKISLTNKALKEKIASTIIKNPKTTTPVASEIAIKPKDEAAPKDLNYISSFNLSKKSPRELAIFFQAKLKRLKDKYTK